MKKLSKVQINPEKLIENKDLIALRGGYGCDYPCWDYCCYCYWYPGQVAFLVDPGLATPQNCDNLCKMWDPYTWGVWQCII
jgi:hypothetical protein